MFSRSHATGMSFIAFQKFWRLAGIDHIHVNGLRNKFCEDDASVIASARECLTPMFPAPHKGCEIMPVFSSGQSAQQAPDTLQGARLDGSDLRLRRRNSRSSRRCRPLACAACIRPGKRRLRASRWPNMPRTMRSCAPRWRRLPRETSANQPACSTPGMATTLPARPTCSRHLRCTA